MKSHTAAATLCPRRGLLVLCAFMLAVTANAQQQPSPADETIFTLHTYTNLVQIPTLVLDSHSNPPPPIPRNRFAIQLDYGPAFHPTAMHIEGDDAIDLALLLDASGDQKDILEHFDDAFAALVPSHLRPQDHITIYALDCELVRSEGDLPANAAVLRSSASAVLTSPALHGHRGKSCGGDVRLRDSLMRIAKILSQDPGRRVILTISNGHYDRSSADLAEAGRFISQMGVAVFALRGAILSNHIGSLRDRDPFLGPHTEPDLFPALCQTTGGTIMNTTPVALASDLGRILDLVRSRYIIEFPRPNDDRPGFHQIDITIQGTHDYIAHTGATVQLPNPSTKTDPNIIPTAKSPATYGNHHP